MLLFVVKNYAKNPENNDAVKILKTHADVINICIDKEVLQQDCKMHKICKLVSF